MTEAKSDPKSDPKFDPKAEIKCCDRDKNAKFCSECGKKISQLTVIPAYRLQLDKRVKCGNLLVCGDTFPLDGEFKLAGMCADWKDHHDRAGTILSRSIDELNPPGMKFVRHGTDTLNNLIIAMIKAGVSDPLQGDCACFISDYSTATQVETLTGKPQPVTVKYSMTKCLGCGAKNEVLQCKYSRKGCGESFVDALDEIKTDLYYSPLEHKLYSSRDLLDVIGRTLDFLRKDLAAITRIHRIRGLDIRVITKDFENLPLLCHQSAVLRKIAAACEGVSSRDLHAHLYL